MFVPLLISIEYCCVAPAVLPLSKQVVEVPCVVDVLGDAEVWPEPVPICPLPAAQMGSKYPLLRLLMWLMMDSRVVVPSHPWLGYHAVQSRSRYTGSEPPLS